MQKIYAWQKEQAIPAPVNLKIIMVIALTSV
jgi:hypothetical protein